jgi:hypothetical protein
MYGRADGMPSFQLTMAVRAQYSNSTVYTSLRDGAAGPHVENLSSTSQVR